MDAKEKMREVIKKKQQNGGGRDIQSDTPKNDRKFMRKAPIIFK
ncbi:MAG: hypothetical protein ABS873_02850 [Alkalibacterium sp.]